MRDRLVVFFAAAFLLAAILVPLAGLGVGWYTWDATTGLFIAAGFFLGFVVLGGILLFQIESPTWFTVILPYLFGVVYTVLPDLIPLGVDDAAVTAIGSGISYLLAFRKDSRTPRWVILPLLVAAVYAVFGNAIPGGLDEVLVDALALLAAGYGVQRATDSHPM